jgi:hypothetical protein
MVERNKANGLPVRQVDSEIGGSIDPKPHERSFGNPAGS